VLERELDRIQDINLHVHEAAYVVPSDIRDLGRADTVAKVAADFR
jgi:hypothetical protein